MTTNAYRHRPPEQCTLSKEDQQHILRISNNDQELLDELMAIIRQLRPLPPRGASVRHTSRCDRRAQPDHVRCHSPHTSTRLPLAPHLTRARGSERCSSSPEARGKASPSRASKERSGPNSSPTTRARSAARRGRTRRVSLLRRKPVLYNDPRMPIRRSANGCGRPVRPATRLAFFAVPR